MEREMQTGDPVYVYVRWDSDPEKKGIFQDAAGTTKFPNDKIPISKDTQCDVVFKMVNGFAGVFADAGHGYGPLSWNCATPSPVSNGGFSNNNTVYTLHDHNELHSPPADAPYSFNVHLATPNEVIGVRFNTGSRDRIVDPTLLNEGGATGVGY